MNNTPMFESRSRVHLTPQGIMEIVTRIARRASVDNPTLPSLLKLKPHDLRRSCANMAKNGGADLDMIQHMLGHASVQTTERYLQQIQNLKLGQTAPDHIKINVKAGGKK